MLYKDNDVPEPCFIDNNQIQEEQLWKKELKNWKLKLKNF